jgi:hypothetical protein
LKRRRSYMNMRLAVAVDKQTIMYATVRSYHFLSFWTLLSFELQFISSPISATWNLLIVRGVPVSQNQLRQNTCFIATSNNQWRVQ